jgi:hypothetical protein
MKANRMIPMFCAIVFILLCAIPVNAAICKRNYYAKSARVIEIDRDADVVTFEDCMGNLWDWEGVEDWAVDDNAALLMNSKGTEKIYDDEIISAKFENWA